MTGLADQNPSKRSGGTPRYSRPEPGGPDAGRIAASRPAGPAAAPPAARPPARTTRLGPGRGRPAVTGSGLISKPASACLPADPVRPGPGTTSAARPSEAAGRPGGQDENSVPLPAGPQEPR
jgi:hypothetical protein